MDTRLCDDFDDNQNAWIKRWWKVRGTEGTETISAWGRVHMHGYCAHTLECFDGCLLLHVLLNVSEQELLVIFPDALFSRCCWAVQHYFPPQTHMGSCSPAFPCFENKIFPIMRWVVRRLSPPLCYQVTHADRIKLPTQTKIWIGSVDLPCLKKLHQYWTWY